MNFFSLEMREFKLKIIIKMINSKSLEKSKVSNEDLMTAIKQVAKEMADAMRTKSLDIEDNHDYNDIKDRTVMMNNDNDNDNNDDYDYNDNEIAYNEPKGLKVIRKVDISVSGSKNLYDKSIESSSIKKYRLELQRSKKLNDEMKQLKNKPDISHKSREIIKSKFSETKPIHLRVGEVLESKENELKKLWYYYNILLNNDLKEINKAKQGVYDEEKFKDFVNNQLNWLSSKREKINYIKSEIDRLESEASKSLYKPQINKTSENIAKSKKAFEMKVHDRLHNHAEEIKQKKELLASKNIPSFTPLIYKNKPKYINTKEKDRPDQLKEIQQFEEEETQTNVNNDFLLEKYLIALKNSSKADNPINQQIKENMKTISQSAVKRDLIDELDEANYYNDSENNQDNDRITDTSKLYKLNIENKTIWRDKPNTVILKQNK